MLRFLLILALLLSACSDGERDNDNAATVDGIIRISEADARGLDPQLVSDLASIRIAADQFEGLTRFDARGEAIAGLADSWKVSGDGLTWTFRLRDGLTFSDGEPITPEHFERALSRIRDEKTGSPHGALFSVIETIEVVDSLSLRLKLTGPFPQLPALLAHPAMSALPFHRIDEMGERWTSERPLVTSGPYRLRSWRLAEALELEANPNWHGGKPETSQVIWRPMDNAQSAMRLMLAGGADTSSNFPASRLQWLQENYPDMLRLGDYLGSYYYAFNTRKAPFDDARVRRALSLAVNRKWIAEKMMAAGNEAAWGLLPPGLSGGKPYRPEWADGSREQRLAKARQLLAEAGYGPENPLRFEIRFNSSAEHRRVSVALSSMWRDIGVEARLLNSEAGLHFDALRRADFTLARSGWIADLPAPENFLSVHRSDAGTQNYSGYANPDYDAALDAALAEADPQKRLMLMKKAERILIADAPILPLYFYASRNLVRSDMKGWYSNDSNIHPSAFLRK